MRLGSSIFLSTDGTRNIAPGDTLTVGVRSATNVWPMIAALTKRYPDIDWGVHLAAGNIELSPLLDTSKLIGVKVDHYHANDYYPRWADEPPITIERLQKMPARISTAAVYWQYDVAEAPDHEERCANDYCRCITIENIRNPKLDIQTLVNELTAAFHCSYSESGEYLAILAGAWKAIIQDQEKDALAKNCAVERMSGYYGEELGSTYLSPDWSRKLVDCVHQGMELTPALLRELSSLSREATKVPLTSLMAPMPTESRIDAFRNFMKEQFPSVVIDIRGIDASPSCRITDRESGLSRWVTPAAKTQKWLTGERKTPSPYIVVPILAVAPLKIFAQVNQILDRHLSSDPVYI